MEGRSPPVMYPEEGILLSNPLMVAFIVSSIASFALACRRYVASQSTNIAPKVKHLRNIRCLIRLHRNTFDRPLPPEPTVISQWPNKHPIISLCKSACTSCQSKCRDAKRSANDEATIADAFVCTMNIASIARARAGVRVEGIAKSAT